MGKKIGQWSIDMRNPGFAVSLQDWREDLETLRQNWLLHESQLITFARERGVPVDGVIVGEPGEFHRRGWLCSDDEDGDGAPRFHPFRLYVLRKILQRKMAVGSLFGQPRELEHITKASQQWNDVVNLATMLEPLYWPSIVGSTRMGIGSDKAFRSRLERYRRKALDSVNTLDPKHWRKIHDSLRVDAGWMDSNDTLYALLRLSDWHERKDLSGAIGGALWIRHLAEVIRRGFEEAYREEWPQEFHAFGMWHATGLKRVFGSSRPFDDPMRAKPFLARAFGLFTGSSVRWYVEGETEYYAALEILREPSRTSVELVNLRGNVKADRDNVALKLEDWLKEDQALRRFSMISFDSDTPVASRKPHSPSPNVKAIRRQVEKDNVVGLIAVHRPDFEFANFSVEELAETAARIDEAHGFSGARLRRHDWTGISNGKAFEREYQSISQRKRGTLKGEAWGRTLAAYAIEHPRKEDGTERPIWNQLHGAWYGWMANYDVHRERFRFDPETFELIPR
jgi:hypothetical protein